MAKLSPAEQCGKKVKRLVVIAALLAASGLVAAQDSTEQTKFDRFELWNMCRPIYLVVEGLHNDAAEIGISEDQIGTTVRSRLRAARIYNADRISPYLYVRVTVVGQAFSVQLSLWKFLTEVLAPGIQGMAQTWVTGSIGTHGQDAGYILQSVSNHTDKFIDEYLRVNVEDCKR